MKKIVLLAAILFLATVAQAGSASCAKDQWLNGNKCVACPTGGKCDGNTFRCDTGNRWTQSGSKCVCNGYWKYKSSKDPNHCYACPKNATCNGGNGISGIRCNSGYMLSGEKCVELRCGKNEWVNNGKCTSCPADASCDGKKFKCNKNFAQSGNKCVRTACDKGQWMNNGRCAACPANAECKNGQTFKCNKNFAQAGNTCVPTKCGKNEWLNGTKCTACPANAECKDGKTLKCNAGYIQKNNTCVYQNAVASDCEKYGSHVSHEWIEARQKDCVDCGIQVGSKGEIVYWCYCGKGCKGVEVSKAVGGKKGTKAKIKACAKEAAELAGLRHVTNGDTVTITAAYCIKDHKGNIKKCAKDLASLKNAENMGAVATGGTVATFTGSQLMGSYATLTTKYTSCVTRVVVKKLTDKLKKAIKKIF